LLHLGSIAQPHLDVIQVMHLGCELWKPTELSTNHMEFIDQHTTPNTACLSVLVYIRNIHSCFLWDLNRERKQLRQRMALERFWSSLPMQAGKSRYEDWTLAWRADALLGFC
jgi:hypothetical protein